MSAVARTELVAHLDELLGIDRFEDYAPNGLQIEGRDRVAKLAVGVSANEALVREAIAWGADALLVHHGFFWRNEPRTITGPRRRRIAALLGAEISLLAYHLPLDAHPELGNNALLLRAMGARPSGMFGPGRPPIGAVGVLEEPVSRSALLGRLEDELGRPCLLLDGAGERTIRDVAVCTGGGASFFEAAAERGVDLFVTGEPTRRNVSGFARSVTG
jgi:dinuclear metal center YbgI/SA1388 family protein